MLTLLEEYRAAGNRVAGQSEELKKGQRVEIVHEQTFSWLAVVRAKNATLIPLPLSSVHSFASAQYDKNAGRFA
jgi:hypothetical protein